MTYHNTLIDIMMTIGAIIQINSSNAVPIDKQVPNLVITVPTDVLAPNDAKPSVGTFMTEKLSLAIKDFIQSRWLLKMFQYLKTSLMYLSTKMRHTANHTCKWISLSSDVYYPLGDTSDDLLFVKIMISIWKTARGPSQYKDVVFPV